MTKQGWSEKTGKTTCEAYLPGFWWYIYGVSDGICGLREIPRHSTDCCYAVLFAKKYAVFRSEAIGSRRDLRGRT
jgi:hypothetical protein